MSAAARRHNRRQSNRMRRFFQRAPDEVTEETKDTLQEAAEVVQFDAIRLATSQRVKQALADPSAIGRKSNGLRVEFGLRTKRQRRLAWFAHFLEWGTRPHSISKGSDARKLERRGATILSGGSGWHPGMAAQPFFVPAFEMNRAENRRRRDEAVARGIKTALKGSRNV